MSTAEKKKRKKKPVALSLGARPYQEDKSIIPLYST
jgi:hypothetical protein